MQPPRAVPEEEALQVPSPAPSQNPRAIVRRRHVHWVHPPQPAARSDSRGRSSVSTAPTPPPAAVTIPDRLFLSDTWWVVDGESTDCHGEVLHVGGKGSAQCADVTVWNEERGKFWDTMALRRGSMALGSWQCTECSNRRIIWLHAATGRNVLWLRHREEAHPPMPVLGGIYRVRFARPTDVPRCLELEEELVLAHKQIKGWEDKSMGELYKAIWPMKTLSNDHHKDRREQWYSVLLGEGKGNMTLVIDRGHNRQIVAMLHVATPRPPAQAFAEIHQVSVTAELRGQGLGEMLLRHVVDFLGGATEFQLTVGTAATSMYLRCGFRSFDRFRSQGVTWLKLRRPPPGQRLQVRGGAETEGAGRPRRKRKRTLGYYSPSKER